MIGNLSPDELFGRPSLTNWTIGISISESPDLPLLGMGEVHLQDALVEFARYLLASGGTLAYGGDLRERGFTEILLDLVQTHNQSGTYRFERVINFLAWPIHLKLTQGQRAQLKRVADFRPLDPPSDLTINKNEWLGPDSLLNRYIWARSLTLMREEMNRLVHARILLGGKYQTGSYRGKYPGLAEEALVALCNGTPLFLIGGFGGCAREIIDCLRGKPTEKLTAEYQMTDTDYSDFVSFYNEKVIESPTLNLEAIDYHGLASFYKLKGISGLGNGLNDEDNLRLFETPFISEMISLVLKGLTKLLQKKK
jgi:hypothetical protein